MSKHPSTSTDSPRPLKRQRIITPSSSPQSPSLAQQVKAEGGTVVSSGPAPLPAPQLLLALPALLVQPPGTPHHARSLHLARMALHKCLSLPVDRDVECRAWTALVEIGLRTLGLDRVDETTRGEVEGEVEKGIMKALMIAQKHPKLRLYTPHLTHLSTLLPSSRANPRKITTSLKRLLTTFYMPSDPAWMVYTTHLGLVNAYLDEFSSSSTTSPSTSTSSFSSTSTAGIKALSAIHTLQSLASRNAHREIVLLTHVLRVRVLVTFGRWAEVGAAVRDAEGVFGVDVVKAVESAKGKDNAKSAGDDTKPTSKDAKPNLKADIKPTSKTDTKPLKDHGKPTSKADIKPTSKADLKPPSSLTTNPKPKPKSKVETSLLIHLLVLTVLYHTYAGDTPSAAAYLRELHALLDSGGLDSLGGDGIVKINLSQTQPLHIQLTHPRILYLLVFLLSAQAKRDPVGRNPKKRVFAAEGVGVVERKGGVGKGVIASRWTSSATIRELDRRTACIKAELLCELVSVAMMRSEFGEVEKALSTLISHTRSTNLFGRYSGRVTLFYAQLAHARGEVGKAAERYEVAAYLARPRGSSSSKRQDSPRKGDSSPRKGQGASPRKGAESPMDVDAQSSSPSKGDVKPEGEGEVGGGKEEEEEGEEDTYVHASARAGLIALRIGAFRSWSGEDGKRKADAEERKARSDERKARSEEWKVIRKEGGEVARMCLGLGGTLGAVGEILMACLGEGEGESGILGSKTHLRTALSLSTRAQDNYLRLLVLCFIAAHYLHTSPEHAMAMLKTGEVLALGLGARKGAATGKNGASGTPGKTTGMPGKGKEEDGGAPVRLWIGERFCDLHKWYGDDEQADKQALVNDELRRKLSLALDV
ncbi:hypothetical protein BDQ17DRAFT_1313621 [Cyathus striatus]|nr:hypothetical protein BDQ17DRAFT_1313621 [Cyathus striatus]